MSVFAKAESGWRPTCGSKWCLVIAKIFSVAHVGQTPILCAGACLPERRNTNIQRSHRADSWLTLALDAHDSDTSGNMSHFLPSRIALAVVHIKTLLMASAHAQHHRLCTIALRSATYARDFRRRLGGIFFPVLFVLRSLAAFGGPSLRRISARVHRRHFRHNPTITSFRYSWWRLRINAIARHPLISLGLLIFLFIAAALLCEHLVAGPQIKWLVADAKDEDFQNIMTGLLAAQAALIALVFPLIIALIGVLFELRTTSGVRINIFLKETESLVVGGSALTLSAALAIQLLLFPHLPVVARGTAVILDVLWFVVNVAFLAFFLFGAVNFVRPERRTNLYRRYVVNIAWRVELRNLIIYNRLTNAVEYGYLPTTPGDLEDGPKVLVSAMNLDSMPVAVQLSLRQSSVMTNAFLPVLHLVAKAWLQRAPAGPEDRSLTWLVFQAVPLVTYDRNVVLARSPANVPLTSLERFFVRHAFQFRNTATQEKAADTAALLKEYAGDLLPLIDAGRVQEFDQSLSDLIDLHVFLFKIAQSPEDEQSREEPFNFAEMMNQFEFQTIGDSWASEYKDILKRAVARLESAPEFFSICAYLGVRIYREAREVARPAALTSIITNALTLFWRLKEWAEATQQAESGRIGNPGSALRLSAARSSAYAEAWRNYVAGWERLGSEIASFEISSAEDWPKVGSHYSSVFDHLKGTATMVAAAAKGGDLLAVEWSTDMLIKWLEHMRRGWGDQDDGLLSDGLLVSPDVLGQRWANVATFIRPLLGDVLQPRSLFSVAMAHAHVDVQLVLICVLLRWCLQSGAKGAAGSAARKVLRGEMHDRDAEAEFHRASFESFTTAFESVIRVGYADGRLDGGYGATIGSLAERLDDVATEPYVSGRIYSTDAIRGFYQLRVEQALVLMALASRTPAGGAMPANIQAVLQRVSAQDDSHARRLLAQLEQLRDAILNLDAGVHGPIFSALTA